MRGIPSHTIIQGELVFVQGDLRTVQGKGRYLKRPAFGAGFAAAKQRAEALVPTRCCAKPWMTNPSALPAAPTCHYACFVIAPPLSSFPPAVIPCCAVIPGLTRDPWIADQACNDKSNRPNTPGSPCRPTLPENIMSLETQTNLDSQRINGERLWASLMELA